MDSNDSPSSYEDVRRQRLEENKKRMQELGLRDISTSLSNGFTRSKSPASRPAKARVPKEIAFLELRRSSRVANNLQPSYNADHLQPICDEFEIDRPKRRKRARFVNLAGSRSYKRSLAARKRASAATRMKATLKAEILMKSIQSDNASFVKSMLLSHVTGGFWLGLPAEFCRTHLPKDEDMIVLENEKGEEWETVYLANKTGLSGGWRGFSLDNKLVDGDALVFELVETHRFKVRIVRAAEPEINLDEEKHISKETDEKTQDVGQKTLKRKQRLIREYAYSGIGSDGHCASLSKKGSKRKTRVVQDFKCASENAEASQKLLYHSKNKGNNSGQKRLERDEGWITRNSSKEEDNPIQNLFEDAERIIKNDRSKKEEVSQQITTFLRSKKPHASLLDGAPKKVMLT